MRIDAALYPNSPGNLQLIGGSACFLVQDAVFWVPKAGLDTNREVRQTSPLRSTHFIGLLFGSTAVLSRLSHRDLRIPALSAIRTVLFTDLTSQLSQSFPLQISSPSFLLLIRW